MAGRVVSSSLDSSERKRNPRQSRGVASKWNRGGKGGSLDQPRSVGGERRSVSHDFVDARSMNTNASVAERLNEQQFGGSGMMARPKVVDFPERLREKRKAHRRRIIRYVCVVALIVALVGTLIWGLLFSPMLLLRKDGITVQGTNTWVSSGEVSELAQAQVGKSLLLINTEQIEDKIGALPGVTSANATKQYPHGLNITVKAEVPAAVLKSSSGLTAVDREGRTLNAVNASVKGIPVIQVRNTQDGLSDKAVKEALKILGSLDESMRQRINKGEAKTQDSVTVTTSDGYTIIWGNSSELALKKAVVSELLKNPKQLGGAKTINVAAPDKAIIK